MQNNFSSFRLSRSEIVILLLSLVFLLAAITLAIFDQRQVAYIVGFLGISINIAIWTLVNEVRKSLDSVIPYFRIRNGVFQLIASYKLEEFRNILAGLEGDTINLNVSDLFSISKLQIQSAKEVSAVDVKSKDLLFTDQLNDYLATVKKASESGTKVHRIIVLPNDFRCLIQEIEENRLSSNTALRAARTIIRYVNSGTTKLQILFQDDLDDPTYPLDFAIFDSKVVLHDPYTFIGRQSTMGYVSVASSKIDEYQNRFDFLSKEAEKNGQIVDKLIGLNIA